jgi:erythromycin esterase-like protein
MAKQDKSDPDAYFYTLQNARVVKDAESYYRNAYSGRVNTWNIRDRHMLSTLVELLNHLSQTSGHHKKAVVWAHNSHLGDASQTENKKRGKINLDQLVREYYGIRNTFNIGFTTYTGSVTAADNWGEDPQFKIVNEGMGNSYEELFHEVCASTAMNLGDATFCMVFRSNISNNNS